MDNVITGALALVKVNGIVIGKMKGIQVNENFQRARVGGLGLITPDELPIVSWAGTLRCDFYNIDFGKSQVPGAVTRVVASVNDFVDNMLLDDIGVQVEIYKKELDLIDPVTKLRKAKPSVYATVKGCFIDAEGFDITEGQVSGRNQSFTYKFPVIK